MTDAQKLEEIQDVVQCYFDSHELGADSGMSKIASILEQKPIPGTPKSYTLFYILVDFAFALVVAYIFGFSPSRWLPEHPYLDILSHTLGFTYAIMLITAGILRLKIHGFKS